MARLLEDSEDDLPDLNDVFRRHAGAVQGDKKLAEPKVKPQVRRKVVLQPRKDNPLLQPLDKSSKTSASSAFLKDPTDQEEVVPSRSLTAKGAGNLQVNKRKSRAIVTEGLAKPIYDSLEEDDDEDDDDGMSDFIVNDSSYLEEDDHASPVAKTPPPARSPRKLVWGRRPRQSLDSIDDDYVPQPRPSTPEEQPKALMIEDEASNSDLEVPMAILSFSPTQNKSRKVSTEVSKTLRFTTPPPSPSKPKSGLVSPKKGITRIPLTPHRPSMDAFWRQDVIDEWNDEFSPKKTPRAIFKVDLTGDSDSLPSEQVSRSTRKSPAKKDKVALQVKKDFLAQKHSLASSFLQELDQAITGGQVSQMSESTGGISIVWSKTLQTTAGRANWRREGVKPRPLDDATGSLKPTHRHYASIELAEKVIDDEDRLLNVIAHEFCHLANFMVSGIKNNPHGKEFKVWAAKCSKIFGHRGVEVTTKHSYAIDYKYIWTCTSCSMEFKRHSKSVDPKKHSCGSCKSRLVQTKPVPRTAADGAAAGPNEYQMFVKQHMKTVRAENPGSPQKDIMGLVGKRYQEFKASKLNGGGGSGVAGQESSGNGLVLDGGVDAVVKKLNFLDLTSP